MSRAKVVVLPGDGIGPEIVAAAQGVLERVGEFEWSEQLLGGCSIDAHGTALTEEVLEQCRGADAVLLGAVGGPRWDTTDPAAPRPEQGLLGLRKGLGLFANLRPVRPSPALADSSPLRPERIAGTDLLVVRELTGGIYFGESGRDGDTAHDDCSYSAWEIERIARVAFEAAAERARTAARVTDAAGETGANGEPAGAARAIGEAGGRPGPRVTSVDKANVMESSRLWRETVSGMAAEFPSVALEHELVDAMAMHLVARPADFDVILAENLFGDILSDEAAMLTGSLGMLPSASIGSEGAGLFEPIHGSAPDIAGQGLANPLATILSGAMMLRHGLGMPDAAGAVERAVDSVLEQGLRTPDIHTGAEGERRVGTEEMAAAVAGALGSG